MELLLKMYDIVKKKPRYLIWIGIAILILVPILSTATTTQGNDKQEVIKRRPAKECFQDNTNCTKNKECCSHRCVASVSKTAETRKVCAKMHPRPIRSNNDTCSANDQSCENPQSCCSGHCGHRYGSNSSEGFYCRDCQALRPPNMKWCVKNNYRCESNDSCCSQICEDTYVNGQKAHVCQPHQSQQSGCVNDGGLCTVPSQCCSGHCGLAFPWGIQYFCQKCEINEYCLPNGQACTTNASCCTNVCSNEVCQSRRPAKLRKGHGRGGRHSHHPIHNHKELPQKSDDKKSDDKKSAGHRHRALLALPVVCYSIISFLCIIFFS